MLIGTPPPDNAARNRIAFKTGTSYGYRDAWAIGFDGRRTVGVWVGRPDGAPVPGILGRTAAAPILFDAFARFGDNPAPSAAGAEGHDLRRQQQAAVAAAALQSGRACRPQCRAGPHPVPAERRASRTRLRRRPHRAGGLKISGGVEPLTVLVNGVPQERSSGRVVFFAPEGPGFTRLTVVDAKGKADSVMVRLQ